MTALVLLISALALVSVVVISHYERRTFGKTAPPIVLLALAAVAFALTLFLVTAPAVSPTLRGSLSQRPSGYLGLGASAVGLISAIGNQSVRHLGD